MIDLRGVTRSSSGLSIHQSTHRSSTASPLQSTFEIGDTAATMLDPMQMLNSRLPLLLSLSLSLLALFESTPTPSGISRAFVSLEAILMEQLGAWCSEIGQVITSGLLAGLDTSFSTVNTPGVSRRGSVDDLDDQAEWDQEGRLALADIVRSARTYSVFVGLTQCLDHHADSAGATIQVAFPRSA